MKYPLYELKKSPGYYSCLSEVKDPKPIISRPSKPPLDTYAAIIERERHDADMARQAARMTEEKLAPKERKASSIEEDWVMVVNDMVGNKYCGR